jgi:hypothetical protein
MGRSVRSRLVSCIGGLTWLGGLPRGAGRVDNAEPPDWQQLLRALPSHAVVPAVWPPAHRIILADPSCKALLGECPAPVEPGQQTPDDGVSNDGVGAVTRALQSPSDGYGIH